MEHNCVYTSMYVKKVFFTVFIYLPPKLKHNYTHELAMSLAKVSNWFSNLLIVHILIIDYKKVNDI